MFIVRWLLLQTNWLKVLRLSLKSFCKHRCFCKSSWCPIVLIFVGSKIRYANGVVTFLNGKFQKQRFIRDGEVKNKLLDFITAKWAWIYKWISHLLIICITRWMISRVWTRFFI
ncbi:uncharacterized protein [Rutidosis leptorrhynchoides]|uniref:uncharacterized protein isoform X2 n=1 Tax=Rutidosis leptorrhynchoides TaxID=125765 RepID=UPI003A992CD8